MKFQIHPKQMNGICASKNVTLYCQVFYTYLPMSFQIVFLYYILSANGWWKFIDIYEEKGWIGYMFWPAIVTLKCEDHELPVC